MSIAEKLNLSDDILNRSFAFAGRMCWVVDDTIGYTLSRRSETQRYSDVRYAYRPGVATDIINDIQNFLGTTLSKCRKYQHGELRTVQTVSE